MEDPIFLNAKEAAAYMRTSVSTIYALAGREFPLYNFNTRILVEKKDLIDYIKKHKKMYK